MPLKAYQQRFARFLAETGSLFFRQGLVMKDGRPTPYFVNMGRFCTGRTSYTLGSFFAQRLLELNRLAEVDILLGPSYKGSAIAQAMAVALWTGEQKDLIFEYDRKEIKNYGEASGQKNLMVNNSFFEGCGLWIVDDVISSMATKYELLEKIAREEEQKKISVRIVGLCVGVDREQTTACYDQAGRVILGKKGEDTIRQFTQKTGVAVYAIAPISEVVDYLFSEQIPALVEGAWEPISIALKTVVDDYLLEYGTR